MAKKEKGRWDHMDTRSLTLRFGQQRLELSIFMALLLLCGALVNPISAVFVMIISLGAFLGALDKTRKMGNELKEKLGEK